MGSRPNEKLNKAFFAGGPFAKIGQTTNWAGRTTLSSGSSSVTVSTALVNSDSLILKCSEVASVGVGANSGGAILVNSIVSATSFAFARATGTAAPWDETVMWMLIRTSQV